MDRVGRVGEMALVARASKTVRTKNLLIVVLCALFTGWFGYDGFIGYPAGDDRLVAQMRDVMVRDGRVDVTSIPVLQRWKGWSAEDQASRSEMDKVVKSSQNYVDVSGWKSPFEIQVQRGIMWGLAAVTMASVGWLIHCQRRRAIADDKTVSPRVGLEVPWDRIVQVDNTRWKSMGIVEITYLDAGGKARKAKFDDYELERDPLLAILDQLAERAVEADFIPREAPEGSSKLTA
jgi:hypothetical protein